MRSMLDWSRPAAVAVGLLIASLAPANAASFDCAKARDALEKTICADQELSRLDERLAELFKAASTPLDPADRAALLADQRKWLRGRTVGGPEWEACEPDDALCLKRMYEERVEQMADIADHPRAAVANLLWTQGVACRGNKALVRFLPGDLDIVTSRMPPDIGGDLARLPGSPKECRLADGRVVRFAVGSMGDAMAHGPCGGDNSSLYSVWIGRAKVISREEQRGKCGFPYTVRAVFLDGGVLTECREKLSTVADGKTSMECRDISSRLKNPAKEERPLGSFVVSSAAPGEAQFCRQLIRDTDDGGGYEEDSIWPAKTALPGDAEEPDDLKEKSFDVNNSGQASKAILVAGYGGYFDGAFWVLPPATASAAEIDGVVAELEKDAAPENARKKGFQVFAGDQTTYGEARYVTLRPFFRNGKTYMHASWLIRMLDKPSALIVEPQPDGTLKTVCAYAATPTL